MGKRKAISTKVILAVTEDETKQINFVNLMESTEIFDKILAVHKCGI